MSTSRTRVPAASGPTVFAHPTPGWTYPGNAQGPAEARNESQQPAPQYRPKAPQIPVMAETGPGGGVVNTPEDQYTARISLGDEILRPYNRALLEQSVKVRKSGLLNVGQKAVIALRFDDGQDAMYSTVYPLLRDRGLPFSIALISRWASRTWGANTTAAQIQEMVNNGGEIWSHGLDHDDYIGYQGLYDNIVVSKSEINAALNCRIKGFSLPGVTPIYDDSRGHNPPYYGLTKSSDFYSPAGRLLLDHYEQAEAYDGNGLGYVGQGEFLFGRGHYTVTDGVTLAAAQSLLADVIAKKQTLRIMGHPANLGQPGRMTVADFTAFLDSIVAARDAGTLEIVTPSSLNFVASSGRRLDLMHGQGTLVGISAATPGVWNVIDTGTTNTVFQSGGKDNGPYVLIPEAGGSGPNTRPFFLGQAGETFVFSGYAKAMTPGSTVPRVIVQSYANTAALNLSRTFVGVTDAEWKKIVVPFTIPARNADGTELKQIAVQVTRNSGVACGWSDMKIEKV